MSLELIKRDKEIVKKIGKYKMIIKFIAAYKNLCKECQQKVHQNPRTIYDTACDKCKKQLDELGASLKCY